MKRFPALLAACLFSLLVPSAACQGQESDTAASTGYPRAMLGKPYTPMLGDLIALSTSELLSAFKGFSDSPAIAIYDRDAKRIVVIEYGSKSTLDGAKKAIDEMREAMKPKMMIVGSVYKLSLDGADFGYIYSHEGKELVRWEDGKYTVEGE